MDARFIGYGQGRNELIAWAWGARYYHPADALASLRYVSGTKLDERIIRADLDPGYAEGRQYGRGKSGGQVCLHCALNKKFSAPSLACIVVPDHSFYAGLGAR